MPSDPMTDGQPRDEIDGRLKRTETGRMLSTYIVETGEPVAVFTRA